MALVKAVQNLMSSASGRVCVLIPWDLHSPREGCTEPDGLGICACVRHNLGICMALAKAVQNLKGSACLDFVY